MANQKLSQLTELAVEPADVDEIYVSDGGTSKRITYGTLKTALLARANHTGTQTASTISDFDTEVSNNSDVAANTAKVTNATHSGDAVGDTALTLQPAAITGKGAVTVAAGDLLLVADVSASPQVLGQVTASSVASLATPEGTAILSTGEVGGTKFLREDGDGTCSWQTVPAGTGDLKADGTVPLTADWDVGSFDITAAQFHSDITTGTAPFTVASTTVVTNLNADQVDGNEASALLDRANHTGTQAAATISDFDTEVANNSAVSANTAKVTNATHTGDATGATALTLQPAAITGKGAVTVAGGDLLLVTDVSASPQVLGQVTAQSIADLAAPQGTAIRSDSTSPAATDGYVLTADGLGGAAWEAAAAGSGDFKADGTVDMTGEFRTDVGTFDSDVANGASAVAYSYDTAVAYSTAGAKLASWKNNATEKLYIDKDGTIVSSSGKFGPSADTDANISVQQNSFNYTNFQGNAVLSFLDSTDTLSLTSAGKYSWAADASSAGGTKDTALERSAAGVVKVTDASTGNGAITFSYGQAAQAYTVATLPGTPAVGMMARVTDANAPAVGSTVTGSGAAAALVWYNGSNWTVIGV